MMKYRPDIDGLRAVAIILVVIFHAFPSLMPGGFVGVDIFFVISGYLISGVIINHLADNAFSFANFYGRRILRIFPALSLVLATSLVGGALMLKPDEFMALGKHVLGGAVFISNILLFGETGYFDSAAHAKPLLNLWSLGVEEQFYIIFPLLVWFCWRYSRRLGILFAIFCLLSFADNIFLFQKHPEADFYLPLSRFWELLAGALLQAATNPACRTGKGGWLLQRVVPPAGAAFFGLFLLAAALVVCENDTGKYPGFMAILPVAASFLLIAAGPECAFNRLVLANPASVFIGKISYTLYLWHWPLLSLAYISLGGHAYQQAYFLRLMLVIAAFVLAALTYWFVEKPIRYGKFLGKYKIPALIAAMAAVGAAGLAIWLSNGFVPFLGDRHKAVYDQLVQPPETEAAAFARLGLKKGDLDLCRYNDVGAKTTIAIVGDSHAQSAYPGLAWLGAQKGFNTLLLGRFPVWRHYRDNSGQPARILDILAKNRDIKDVFLIIRGATYTAEGHNPGHRGNDVLPHKNPEEFYAEIADFAKKIVALGKNAVIVEDNPDLDIDIHEAINPGLGRNPVKSGYKQTSRANALARQKPWLEILDRLAAIPGVTVLKGTLDAFCPDDVCKVFSEDGLPLYYDDDHLSLAGSQKLAREIIEPYLGLDK